MEAEITTSRNGTVDLAKGQNDTEPVVITNDYTLDFPHGYYYDTISFSGTKTWEDNNNAAGVRPDSLKLTLNDGTKDIELQSTDPDASFYIEWKKDANKWTYKISKVDIADGKAVAGAKLQVIGPDGKIVKEWTSGKDRAEEITGLIPGEEYVLKETAAPLGYDKITTDITFKVDKDGKVTVVKTGTNSEGKKEGTVKNNVLLVNDTANRTENKTTKTHTTKGTMNNTTGTVKTGDSADPILYLMLLLAAVTAGGSILYIRQRKK